MHASLRYGLACFWLAAGSHHALAQTTPESRPLHLDPAWLTLGHYQSNTFGGGHTSQADDADFFLSPEGKHSPPPSWRQPWPPSASPEAAMTMPAAVSPPATSGCGRNWRCPTPR